MSLTTHLTAATSDHGRLAFHPDCPRCRERLVGNLGADSLVSPRTPAILAAGLLAWSGGPVVAAAQVPDVEEEAPGPAPGAEPPGLQPEFDPGGDDAFDHEGLPTGGPEAGGGEDDGLGPPVETEPVVDPGVPVEEGMHLDPAPVLPDPAAPDSAPPAPPPAPLPPPVLPQGAQPEPPPAAEQMPPKPEPGHKSRARQAPERRADVPKAERRPVNHGNPAPASRAPLVQPAEPTGTPTGASVSQAAPTPTVASSQPSSAARGRITGLSYTVRTGDSLWSIARRLLGPDASAGQVARKVNRLWELNGDRIGTRDPSLLYSGTVLRLR